MLALPFFIPFPFFCRLPSYATRAPIATFVLLSPAKKARSNLRERPLPLASPSQPLTPTTPTTITSHTLSRCLTPPFPFFPGHLRSIRTTKYTILTFLPRNLFEQFHRLANVYFLFIVILNWVPAVNAFGREVAMLPLLFVLGVTAIKDAYEDRRRAKQDKETNSRTSEVYDPYVGRVQGLQGSERKAVSP